MDLQYDKNTLPRVTTSILQVHTDEVWSIAWSHTGEYLASASKDKTAIIWRIGSKSEPSVRECAPELTLRDHPYSVGCIAWSRDDSILLTSADHLIKMWDAKSGICLRTLDAHSETVSALTWLPDGSGFISGGLDRKIILWDAEGKEQDSWGITAMRVTDLAVSPDSLRLVSVGMDYVAPTPPAHDSEHGHGRDTSLPTVKDGSGAPIANMPKGPENCMIIYDLASKQMESSIRLDGQPTSIKISDDSRYALFNHAPDEIHLWDLAAGQLVRKLTGQRQESIVIRSCFGGIDGNFIVSGSEDGNVYAWHRDSGSLLEVLSGHGEGSVNSVAWNPRNEQMFASCSDDKTIRIWEVPSTGTLE
ncbi:hypothetical protein SERLA73DRAFT_186621 [Serpula lacrymans var. lacrymans S7.3]|uniref:Uncharacterized protein n=2 Tax=Serpula lacrymans var. lacrymans TaxID=341189 RepID=F8Q7L0_SERL3|nr:uncharacterized protein SERLADRAFT_475761 [Serpula lacrymans var. lacrymans S7.9]EGN95548.1 hypothetical protein SERLA73DRAFT_186621 [Serpula lacrymans var. lacrymans S7.3]EGO21073.1 hypothetical protein SERLADRAFT_475761 [Serpula lacrymans var. lacrymans S7.9]